MILLFFTYAKFLYSFFFDYFHRLSRDRIFFGGHIRTINEARRSLAVRSHFLGLDLLGNSCCWNIIKILVQHSLVNLIFFKPSEVVAEEFHFHGLLLMQL